MGTVDYLGGWVMKLMGGQHNAVLNDRDYSAIACSYAGTNRIRFKGSIAKVTRPVIETTSQVNPPPLRDRVNYTRGWAATRQIRQTRPIELIAFESSVL